MYAVYLLPNQNFCMSEWPLKMENKWMSPPLSHSGIAKAVDVFMSHLCDCYPSDQPTVIDA
jgi:hypothetical protein